MVFGLNLVCSLQLLVSNCLLNWRYFPLQTISVMLVISRIWKQFYVAPLPGSSQNRGNRMENGSWPFYGAQFLKEIGLKGWWL